MPKLFKTISISMSESQKKSLYKEYEYGIANGFIEGPKLSFSNFFKSSDFNTMVDMQCLDCHHHLRVSFETYAADMEFNDSAFPVDFCPNCGKMQFVPKDIYQKLTLKVFI